MSRMSSKTNFQLTTELQEELREEIIDLLNEYDYSPTSSGVDKILTEWAKNKGWLIELFQKHPEYNGKFQIVTDTAYNRITNLQAVKEFAYYVKSTARKLLERKEKKIGGFTYTECCCIYSQLVNVLENMRRVSYQGWQYEDVTANGRNIKETEEEMLKWKNKKNAFEKTDGLCCYNSRFYAEADYKTYNTSYSFYQLIYAYDSDVVSEQLASKVNDIIPNARAVKGQKTSRMVNKVCGILGIDKDEYYNREFAKFSDAINPIVIHRKSILSLHPVDYFTMSFGNSWASCHTIDKHNRRKMPDNHGGCYSSGTLSYMLDGTSFVFYTIDNEYDGDEPELQDKINRNMFHVGEDKVVQGRVYPRGNDGAEGIYKQFRDAVQKIIADCLGVKNDWEVEMGTSPCCNVITSHGTHYTDYDCFSNCNVSFLKDNDEEMLNRAKISVGHNPICPQCGDTHTYENSIECDYCYDDTVRCECCGYVLDRDDAYEHDGDYYCGDCVCYCEYHDCYEPSDMVNTHIDGYGDVCERALQSDMFKRCEDCGDWYLADRMIQTDDGSWFCDDYCASQGGYTYIEKHDNWYPDSCVRYCEHCSNDVLDVDWDDEHECCVDCLSSVLEDEEDEEAEEAA